MENEELKAILQQISDAELKLGVLMNTINQSNLDIENLSKIKSDLEAKIENTNKEIDLLKNDVVKTEIGTATVIESLKKQELSAENDFNIAKKGYDIKIENLRNQIIGLQASFDTSSIELRERFNTDKTNCENTILTLESQISDYKSINSALSKNKEHLTTGIQKLLFEVDDINKKIDSLNSELTTANSQLIFINSAITENTKTLTSIKSDIVVNQSVLDSLKFDISGLTSEITDLTNHKESIKTELTKDLVLHDDYIKERLNLVTLQDSLTQKENLLKYKFEKAGIPYN